MGPNPVTGVLIRGDLGHSHREEGHVTTEAEPGVIQPQPKDTEAQKPEEARRTLPQSLWPRNPHKQTLLNSGLPVTLSPWPTPNPGSCQFLFFFFSCHDWHVGSEFPNHRSNPRPLCWKHVVLATGWPVSPRLVSSSHSHRFLSKRNKTFLLRSLFQVFILSGRLPRPCKGSLRFVGFSSLNHCQFNVQSQPGPLEGEGKFSLPDDSREVSPHLLFLLCSGGSPTL